MSGFSRKKFIIFIILGIFAIPLINYLYYFIKNRFLRTTIAGELKSASYKVGHLLWKIPFKKTDATHDVKIVIIGSGISGLSAAKELMKNDESDFVILELENNAGGNSRHGENKVGKYPFGAHYLPLPSPDMQELIAFLKEADVIESFSAEGLPVYDERYLCAAPEDRLYINGHWQSGLIPDFGLPSDDKKQIKKFQASMHNLKHAKGKDGLYAFTLPLSNSSQDETYIKLDAISMKEYLHREGYTSEYLFWYVDYCCKDDYGTSVDATSAWAGLHYFCSRRGKAVNAQEHDLLTWPEGNGWLMEKLKQPVTSNIQTGNLAYQVNQKGNRYQVTSLNIVTDKAIQWNCSKIIFACPQFVTAHIQTNIPALKQRAYNTFNYSSWMVGNLCVKNDLKEKGGVPLAWDNVIYNSPSLGYINSNAQYLHRYQPEINLTYYYPFDEKEMDRKKLLQTNHAELTSIMLADLKKVYDELDESIIRYDPFIWGHAMIKPLKGFIWGEEKKKATDSINNSIYFAHTDLSGISVFEEAFYQGIKAARKLLDEKK
jgi:protoporphyrinogen oxidase